MSVDPERTLTAEDALSTASSADPTVGGNSTPIAPPTAGESIGRYRVESRIGAGGMGVVLRAHDPQLDRRVALKLLATRDRNLEAARARLQREAQALAQLNHPNVVIVHDVGLHQGRVFLAMELVEGQTLAEWMRSADSGRPRPWAQVLETFHAAARGLAAAHAVGLVHRDFKPDNVMLGPDGRVRVMDFGLARSQEDDTTRNRDGVHSTTERRDMLAVSMTRTGAMMGTPGYMAPEQWSSKAVTAHSDQFSFCVALYEALYGTRPYPGQNPAEIAYAVLEGRMRPAPKDTKVPSWLRDVVVRGLSRAPSARFPAMVDLITALDRGDRRRRWRRRSVAIGALGLATLSALAYPGIDRALKERRCARAGDSIDTLWNDDVRRSLRTSFEGSALSYAPVTALKLMPWLDEYASEWREHAVAVCTLAEVDQTWDTPTRSKAQWCLDDREQALSSLLEAFEAADAPTIRNAVQATTRLPPVLTCVDPASLAGMVDPPPPQLRPRVAEVQATLSRARSLEASGQYAQSLTLSRDAHDQALELAWDPLTAAALAQQTMALLRARDLPGAEAVATEAYMLAVRSETWDVAATAANDLIFVVGYAGRRPEEGKTWSEHARAAIANAGDPFELRDARRRGRLGSVLAAAGEYDAALHELERAHAGMETALGAEHFELAKSLTNLGNVLNIGGDKRGALARHEQALQIMRDALGPDHPDLATSLLNLGSIQRELHDYPRARVALERARDLRTTHLGLDHPKTAHALDSLGSLYEQMGKFHEALALHEQALAIHQRVLDSDHPDIAASLNNTAAVHIRLGDYDEAVRLFERAMHIEERAFGPRHRRVVTTLNNVGLALHQRGNLESAQDHLERALALGEEVLGPDHPDLVHSLLGLGENLLDQGRPTEALVHLERAATLSSEAQPSMLANVRLELARALWDEPAARGGDRSRARTLALSAHEALTGAPHQVDQVHEIEDWLDEHVPGWR